MKEQNQQKHLVLYADDDREDLHFVRKALSCREPDIELKTFQDGDQLLQFILNRDNNSPSPCLVILDINMPAMNGRETLQRLRTLKEYKDVPVILFSTSTIPHDFAFAEKYKAGFFTKPLNERQMNAIIEKFVDHCNAGVKR